jgi:hypothetical protein
VQPWLEGEAAHGALPHAHLQEQMWPFR